MKTIAFLQNLWVKDPVRVQRIMDTDGREDILRTLLFWGGLTGRRLRAAFGDACDDIVWEESTPQIADNPREVFPADIPHIVGVIDKHAPQVVLTFGRVASDAVAGLRPFDFVHIAAPHPACRGAEARSQIAEAARFYRGLVAGNPACP